VRKVSLTQLRISLTCYDEVGKGYLREQDLENYIFEQIPSLSQLSNLEADFHPYYVFTAVRKFMFFLDPLHKGKINIKDVVACPILREFNELRQAQSPEVESDHDWFTYRAALKIYLTYLNLDTDHNGMLSKEEFGEYNNGALTPVFVDRLFEEYRMYRSEATRHMEMDYKTFLDFVLAMNHKESPQSLAYFWKILDVDHKGYITLHTLNFFFKAVVQRMQQHEPNNQVRVEDVTNEIFDMVRPTHPYRITLQDLIRSEVGHTVVSILTDVNGFWQYDNRESLIAQDDDN
jgi:serine/threonine-protein phosphatase 2A regulatory subunit B''